MIAGSYTDPPALAYANGMYKDSEASSIGYATVYPFTMFLRTFISADHVDYHRSLLS